MPDPSPLCWNLGQNQGPETSPPRSAGVEHGQPLHRGVCGVSKPFARGLEAASAFAHPPHELKSCLLGPLISLQKPEARSALRPGILSSQSPAPFWSQTVWWKGGRGQHRWAPRPARQQGPAAGGKPNSALSRCQF